MRVPGVDLHGEGGAHWPVRCRYVVAEVVSRGASGGQNTMLEAFFGTCWPRIWSTPICVALCAPWFDPDLS